MKLSIVASIAAKRVCSLIWEGDSLVDWVAGGARFHLDGTTVRAAVNYTYRFDAACGSPSGRFAVIYERLGTKGLVLDRGRILREIDRSFYCAAAYEFPVCMARLAVDDTSAVLLSAGWVWQPFDCLCAYRLEDAVPEPKTLDGPGVSPLRATAEICSAALLDDRRIVLATSNDEGIEEPADPNELCPNCLAIWDIAEAKILSQVAVAEPVGTLMAVDRHHAVGFYEHPRLVDLRTGQVVDRLENVETGVQASSIIHHIERPPPLALDAANRRFAVAAGEEILVVEVAPSEQ